MASTPSSSKGPSSLKLGLSLDTWAVLIALLVALLVRVGVLKSVPW